MKNKKMAMAVLLIAAGVVARIIGAETQWYNFAPLAAIGLFSGSIIQDRKWAFVMAIGAQFLVDVYFALFTQTPGFYGVSQLFVYGGLLAATWLGSRLHQRSFTNVAGYTLGASIVFFAVSNLGYFLQGWNGYSAVGLFKTYTDAIPFFKASLLGDALGSALLFGTFEIWRAGVKEKGLSAA